ncbi:hypothetical protein PRIPAC_72952, partial [Pristionchus pacificus]|uniref:Uncharacterized protein n=1 Tax=Pristionchus pacificus TaxID=54126 RepID=A0A2A6CTC7_PRIPA
KECILIPSHLPMRFNLIYLFALLIHGKALMNLHRSILIFSLLHSTFSCVPTAHTFFPTVPAPDLCPCSEDLYKTSLCPDGLSSCDDGRITYIREDNSCTAKLTCAPGQKVVIQPSGGEPETFTFEEVSSFPIVCRNGEWYLGEEMDAPAIIGLVCYSERACDSSFCSQSAADAILAAFDTTECPFVNMMCERPARIDAITDASGCISLLVQCAKKGYNVTPFVLGQTAELYCNDGFVFQNNLHTEAPVTSIGCYTSKCSCSINIYNTEVCTAIGKNCLDILPELEYNEDTGCVTGLTLTCQNGRHLLVRKVKSDVVTTYMIFPLTSPILTASCDDRMYSLTVGTEIISLSFDHEIACSTD